MNENKPYPPYHFVALSVPADFARVILEAATKNKILFADQLLLWSQAGAEHHRLCVPKQTRTGRQK